MLRPNTNTRSNGIPIDDELEAAIAIIYGSSDGGISWAPFNPSASQLVPTSYDEIVLTYSGDNITTVVYKLATTTVATLTLTYAPGTDKITRVQRT